MKTFFTELQNYNDESKEIIYEIKTALDPIYEKYAGLGYPLSEIFTIISSEVFCLMVQYKTKLRRIKKDLK